MDAYLALLNSLPALSLSRFGWCSYLSTAKDDLLHGALPYGVIVPSNREHSAGSTLLAVERLSSTRSGTGMGRGVPSIPPGLRGIQCPGRQVIRLQLPALTPNGGPGATMGRESGKSLAGLPSQAPARGASILRRGGSPATMGLGKRVITHAALGVGGPRAAKPRLVGSHRAWRVSADSITASTGRRTF